MRNESHTEHAVALRGERAQARFAVYFAPPSGSDWAEVGAQWLGRCSDSGEARAQPVPAGWSAQAFHAITSEPRRYGWHATLKAPFHLADGLTEAGLIASLDHLAAQISDFDLPRLAVQRLGQFLALQPVEPCAALQTVAQRCVTDLHGFAAPPSEDEIAARIAEGRLDAEQQALLRRWGYPHVMQRFRFHMTLTGDLRGLSEQEVAQLERHAQEVFSALPQPLPVRALSLFKEPQAGADFVRISRSVLA